MNWKDIVEENNIEVIWVSDEFSDEGAHFPRCTLYPNGAILLRIDIEEERIPFVALHEIGHIVDGVVLKQVNRLLTHLKNERDANCYMIHEVAPEFIVEHNQNLDYATPHRLIEFLKLPLTDENILIAERELGDILKYGY